MVTKQVESVKKNQGKDFHKEIGSLGGNASPTKFTPDSGKKAAEARWKRYRLEQLNKQKGELDGQQTKLAHSS